MNKKGLSQGRIFFVCPDENKPTGGIRSNYRVVDTLNRNGFNAFILHQRPGFRCQWFENQTKVDYFSEIEITKDDYFVLLEMYGPNILNFHEHVKLYGEHIKNLKKRVIIYNRSCYHSFIGYPYDNRPCNTPYTNPDLLGVIAISQDSQDYLQFAFPNLKLHRVRNSINPDIFSYSANKKKQICYMPRRLTEEVRQVVNILRFRGNIQDYELVPIENRSIEDTAKILQESMFFLSFSFREGFGNPPVEAMACGCYVIGYHGGGGREFFKPEFSTAVNDGDIVAFARAVEEAVKKQEENPGFVIEKGKQASQFVRNNYSPEIEEKEVVAAFNALTGKQ